jgi:hypothetical protein
VNPTNRPLTYNVYTSVDGGERFLVVGGINATIYTIMSESFTLSYYTIII